MGVSIRTLFPLEANLRWMIIIHPFISDLWPHEKNLKMFHHLPSI